jgi:5-hydroxyisourate hydrolase
MSQLTTHVLDTSKGKPAAGIPISLYQQQGSDWNEMTRGISNNDGRIPNLLPKETILEPGIYKMKFETKAYFDNQSIETFYPYAEIVFEIRSAEHYHIPLLLNPFGYSTYRGS